MELKTIRKCQIQGKFLRLMLSFLIIHLYLKIRFNFFLLRFVFDF